jgi:hypothetical protein
MSIPAAGIFKPGDIYIIDENSGPTYGVGSMLSSIYFLQHENEVMPALNMEMKYYSFYKLIKFLGCRKLSESCYELKMQCFDDDDDREIEHSLYLHRIRTLQEALLEAEQE